MGFVDLLPFGFVEEGVLGTLEGCIVRSFALQARRMAPLSEPDFAYDPRRGQFGSTEILREVLRRRSADATLVLAVTEADLFIPMLTFVFGLAQLGGRAALISLARLRQEFYGLAPDRSLFLARVAKEALHELGHSVGLVHCLDPACTLSLSTNIGQVDAKGQDLCSVCDALLEEKLEILRAGPGDPDRREERE